jgi:hypothetical protein
MPGWVLQFADLRLRSTDFKKLEIVLRRHELAILRRRSRPSEPEVSSPRME